MMRSRLCEATEIVPCGPATLDDLLRATYISLDGVIDFIETIPRVLKGIIKGSEYGEGMSNAWLLKRDSKPSLDLCGLLRQVHGTVRSYDRDLCTHPQPCCDNTLLKDEGPSSSILTHPDDSFDSDSMKA
jgi:hypothetical protein